MTEREQPPYPAGYHPVPDDDWREQTTPGMTPVRGPGAPTDYGSTGYSRPPVDRPRPYEQPRHQQPGYGQVPADPQGYGPPDYGRTSYGEPTYDRTDYREPTYDRTDYRDPAYGQAGYRDPAYGQAGYGDPAYGRPGAPAGATAPAYSTRPVAVRRPDAPAAIALLVAGIAAAVSLLVTWLAHSQATGWTLLREAFRDLGGLFGTGLWQPLAIIVGGGLLFLLGLALLVPARTHRTLGLVALLVTGGVAAGVIVPLVDAKWHLGVFDLGFFCGIAVAVLGVIGSLKALFTGPRTATRTPPSY
jgi:hypothetical membrane protein